MGQIHNELRRSNLSAALQKALGDTRSDGGLERYSETLQPTLDLYSRPEWALLHHEELFAVSAVQVGGAAGTFAKIGIFNPATSNLIVVVELHHLFPAVGNVAIELFPVAAVLAASQTVQTRDRRRTVSHGAVLHSEASAAAGADLMWTVLPTINGQLLELPIVLPPGRGFMWRTQDDTASLLASFAGYQRVALPGELNV